MSFARSGHPARKGQNNPMSGMMGRPYFQPPLLVAPLPVAFPQNPVQDFPGSRPGRTRIINNKNERSKEWLL